MAKKKKLQVSIWVLIIVIIAAVAAIVISFFVAKGIYDKPQDQIDRISKWGMTVDLHKEADSLDYTVQHSETKESLTIDLSGKYRCPKAGDTTIVNCLDFHGTTLTSLSTDLTGSIKFDEGSFLVNNQFKCPLIFRVGFDKQGKQMEVDGYNYIGKKAELEKALEDALNNSDIENIPVHTDLDKYLENIDLVSNIYYPKDRDDGHEITHNTFFNYNANLVVKDMR